MNKNYYNIDEISQILDEQKHTIRFWETRITKLKVLRTNSGHRLYNYLGKLVKINIFMTFGRGYWT